ncbi:MAG: hypothetical protein KIS92_01010 [Planctomycetota bacterium]|nr:hypothetical protein [Planctomycetota bacterium]
METNTKSEGWFFPINSRKAHFFRNGRSLCGKWGYLGDKFDSDDLASPDDCTQCKKKRTIELENRRSPSKASAFRPIQADRV